MRFKFEKLVCVLGLCAFGTCLLAQQAAGATSPAANPVAKAADQETSPSLFKAQHFDQAAISPDGNRVAWVEILADDEGAPTGKQDIYVQEISAAGKPTRVTAGASALHFNEGSVAWSPDSKRIAFLSDAVLSGQPQLYVASASGGPAHILTDVKGFL